MKSKCFNVLIRCFIYVTLNNEALAWLPENENIHLVASQSHVDYFSRSQDDEWMKKLQDGFEAACKIKSSVEKNRLKRLLTRLKTESEDACRSEENNQFLLEYRQNKWKWIVQKLKTRLADARHLSQGIDKMLMTSILEGLFQDALKRTGEVPELSSLSPHCERLLDALEEDYRLSLDDLLHNKLPAVKNHLGDFSPSVFISYAWGPKEKFFVRRLAEHLKAAGIEVRLDIWHNGLSTAKITDFVNEIEEVDYIILIGSELYGEKCRTGKSNVAFIEARVIAERYSARPNRVLPVLLSGAPKESIPTFLRDQIYVICTEPERYAHQLSALILAMCKYADDCSGLKVILDRICEESDAIRPLPKEK